MAWLGDLPAAPVLLTGDRRSLRAFHHALLADATHATPDAVLVLDGAHCIDPHQVGFQHLMHGCSADHGAERTLIRRAMTPFQWDACLTEGLEQQLHAIQAGLVVAAPFDAQLLREETTDWEQEQYLDAHIAAAHRLARAHGVPMLWSLDLARFSRRAPLLATRITQAVPERRHVVVEGRGWRVTDQDGTVLVRPRTAQRRITDYLVPEPRRVVPVSVSGPAPLRPHRAFTR